MREVGKDSIFCFYIRAEQARVKKLHFLQPGGVVTVAFQAPGAVKLVAPMLKAQPGTWEFRAVLSYKATSGPVMRYSMRPCVKKMGWFGWLSP